MSVILLSGVYVPVNLEPLTLSEKYVGQPINQHTLSQIKNNIRELELLDQYEGQCTSERELLKLELHSYLDQFT